jgi:tetratricopeptide (TPR) repeat protein
MYNKHQQAIAYALEGNWELAVELNLAILDEDADNIAALNRLGRAYTELDQKDAAKTVYKKVLEIDKYNPIALKNLKLLPHQKVGSDGIELSKEDFIEELGLTKTTQLIKVADRKTLLSLMCKQLLKLTARGRLMGVTTTDNVYVGCLPDDLSLRLKSLEAKGYGYSLCVKNATDNTVSIFLREIKRPAKGNAPSTFSHAMVISVHKPKKTAKKSK